MKKQIAKNIIIHKYEEVLQMESEMAKLLSRSNYSEDKEKIDFFSMAVGKILVDIKILAYTSKISKEELDEIFSEVHLSQ